MAATDELTGAWTRRFGLEEVSRELERAHRTGASLLLVFIDVDDLHSVTFGLAEAQPADALQGLLARADADLLEKRRSRSR